jgi:peptide deformylase
MALLHILEYPDPRLHLPARPIGHVDGSVRRLADDMLETMYDAPGVGLAANQVNAQVRLIVLDVSRDRNSPICLINPVIIGRSGTATMDEGCLSLPGIFDLVERAASIRISALDREGKAVDFSADGLLATCIQHEIDHLDGTLFIERLAEMQRRRIDKKLERLRSRIM